MLNHRKLFKSPI